MSDTQWYLVTGHGYQVGLLADRAVADAIAERGRPWIRVAPADGPPGSDAPRVLTGPLDGPHAGWERFSEQETNGQLRELLADRATRSVWVPAQHSQPWYALQVLRTIRNLLRWQALAAGCPCLHAGLIEIDGVGILVAGHKRAGKTSTVLAALSVLHCGFVSNDDATLREGDDSAEHPTRWTGLGWPRSVNIRPDTLSVLAEIAPAIGQLREISTHPRMDYSKADAASFTVYPDDICELLDVQRRPLAPVAAIVLPRFADTSEPVLTRLATDTATEMISQNIDRRATDHDGYLREWFGELDETRARGHAARLAKDLECYELTQSLAAAAVSAELLADLARAARRELV